MKELDRDTLEQVAQVVLRRLQAMKGLGALVARVQPDGSGIMVVLRDGSSVFVPIMRTADGKFRRGDAIIREQSH